jgi:hypothetical protein
MLGQLLFFIFRHREGNNEQLFTNDLQQWQRESLVFVADLRHTGKFHILSLLTEF